MTVGEMCAALEFEVSAGGAALDKEIEKVFCCDLLSLVISRSPPGAAWVTIMGNINTVAVATLAETACVIVADGVTPDEDALLKADGVGVPLCRSPLPIFETAKAIDALIA